MTLAERLFVLRSPAGSANPVGGGGGGDGRYAVAGWEMVEQRSSFSSFNGDSSRKRTFGSELGGGLVNIKQCVRAQVSPRTQ